IRTVFAENMSTRGWVDEPRNGSWWSRWTVMDSVVPYLCNFSIVLVITLDGRYDGSSQAQPSVEGLRFKTLELLEFGYKDYFSDLHDEPAGWTVMAMTVHHVLHNPTLGQNSPFCFSSCTTMPPMDRHEHDEP
ncbi:hypothetical protein EJD97_012868, partial [Solanum chilense]